MTSFNVPRADNPKKKQGYTSTLDSRLTLSNSSLINSGLALLTNSKIMPNRLRRYLTSAIVVTLTTQFVGCTNEGKPSVNQIFTNVAAGDAVIFGDFLPVGMVIAYSGDLTPNTVSSLRDQGWLRCDGTSLAKQDFPALYRVLGAIHGNGRNDASFRLPDYRGRFLRGVDDNTGRDRQASLRIAPAPGGHTGDRIGSTQSDSLGYHEHNESIGITESDSLRAVIGSVDKTPGMVERQQASHAGNQDQETRPKNVNVHYLVYAGIRPGLENRKP